MATLGESFELDKPLECLRCNHKLDMAAQADDDGKDTRPKPEGDGQASVLLCFNCGYLMIVDKDGDLRAPYRREIVEIQQEGTVVRALASLCSFMRHEIDKLKKERDEYVKGTQAVPGGCSDGNPAERGPGREAPRVSGADRQRENLGGGNDSAGGTQQE